MTIASVLERYRNWTGPKCATGDSYTPAHMVPAFEKLVEEMAQKLEEQSIKEKCKVCGHSWQPVIVEGGRCVFCRHEDTKNDVVSLTEELNQLKEQKMQWSGAVAESMRLTNELTKAQILCAALKVYLERTRCSCYTIGTDGTDGGNPKEVKCAKCVALELDNCGQPFLDRLEGYRKALELISSDDTWLLAMAKGIASTALENK